MPSRCWLFGFNYATPHDARVNYFGTYDDALSSRDIWIEAEDEASAQSWGDIVAAAFVAWLFEKEKIGDEPWNQGWPGKSYGSWIEDRPEVLEAAGKFQALVVEVGKMPDFDALDRGWS